MFEYQTEIKMYDTDPAGVLFFANQFRLVHDAYQAFLAEKGLPLGELFTSSPFFLPVVHAKSDFNAPLRVGDTVTVKLKLKQKGISSFTIGHAIYKGKILTGTGETVHVCIDRKSRQKIPLPEKLQEIMGALD
jgi:YbgC/YbaW family acyl-CoA thioester hydrolase